VRGGETPAGETRLMRKIEPMKMASRSAKGEDEPDAEDDRDEPTRRFFEGAPRRTRESSL